MRADVQNRSSRNRLSTYIVGERKWGGATVQAPLVIVLQEASEFQNNLGHSFITNVILGQIL